MTPRRTLTRLGLVLAAVVAVGCGGTGASSPPTPPPTQTAPTAAASVAPTLAPHIELAGRFESERFGYAISHPESWTATPSRFSWPFSSRPELDGNDSISEVMPDGSSVTFVGRSQALPLGMTDEQWLADFHRKSSEVMASWTTCGEPATWAAMPIGDTTGAGVAAGCREGPGAIVVSGGRGYEFSLWTDGDGLPVDAPELFAAMLDSVVFTAAVEPGCALTEQTLDYGEAIDDALANTWCDLYDRHMAALYGAIVTGDMGDLAEIDAGPALESDTALVATLHDAGHLLEMYGYVVAGDSLYFSTATPGASNPTSVDAEIQGPTEYIVVDAKGGEVSSTRYYRVDVRFGKTPSGWRITRFEFGEEEPA